MVSVEDKFLLQFTSSFKVMTENWFSSYQFFDVDCCT